MSIEDRDYGRGTRRDSSSSFPYDLPTRTYAPRGTYGGVRPQYTSTRSNSHGDHSQQEQRRSPRRRSDDSSTCNSSHCQSKHIYSAQHSSSGNSDAWKSKTTCICAAGTSPRLVELKTSNEWQHTYTNLSSSQRTTYSTSPSNHNSKKRTRSNSDSESSSDYASDIRREAKYGSKSDYKLSPRISSRSSRDESLLVDNWDDRSTHERSYEQGRRYDSGRGRGHGYQDDGTAESSLDASVFCKKKLWVGGLPSDITCEEIRKYFEAFGNLIYVMGNAFVKFSTEGETYFAYKQCYTAYIRDKLVKVKYAIRKANKIPHNKLLYINNVPSTVTRTDLKREFEKYGQIEDLQMFTTYRYYFVTFVLEDCAVKARKALKTKYFIQFGKTRAEGKKAESPEPDRLEKASPRVRTLDISECKVVDVLEPLSDTQTQELSELLSSLQPTNSAIKIRRDWILEHTENINDTLLHISVMLVAKDNPYTLRLSTLFLIHDLLSYCTQRRVCTEILDTVSALTLPHLQRVINKFHVDSEEDRKPVLNILSLWGKYSVFPVSVVDDLRLKFMAGDQNTQDEFW